MHRSLRAITGLSVFVTISGRAQEQFGLVHGNWSGPDALALDPTRSAGQWPYASIRLVGADLFAWNDLVALNGDDHSLLREVRNGVRGQAPTEIILWESLRGDSKQGAVVAALPGPAFSLASGRHGFGIALRTRSVTSINATCLRNKWKKFEAVVMLATTILYSAACCKKRSGRALECSGP